MSQRRNPSREDSTGSAESDSTLAVSPTDKTIDYTPIFPDELKLSVRCKEVMSVELTIPPPSKIYPRSGTNCMFGWTRCVHPSGRVYRYHHGSRTIVHGEGPVTPGDWRDCYNPEEMSQRGRLAMDIIERLWVAKSRLQLDIAQCELYLDIPDGIEYPGTTKTARYYFTDWERRTVFWVQDTTPHTPIVSIAHAGIVLESMFWAHVDNFPVHRDLPRDARDDIEAILAYQAIDEATYKESTATWDETKTHLLLKCLHSDSPSPHVDCSTDKRFHVNTHESIGSGCMNGNCVQSTEGDLGVVKSPEYSPVVLSVKYGTRNASVARLWRRICQERCINLFGDADARTSRNESRLAPTSKTDRSPPPVLRRIISVLMFNRPLYFYEQLRDVFVDQILYQRHWVTFAEKDGQSEWRDNSVVAAVVLASNVAFIALGADDKSDTAVPSFSWKSLSLSSTLFSIATIFTTMLLIQSYQHLKSLPEQKANDYMVKCSHRPLGLFGMAMLFSMPFVMLLLALFTFVGAVLGYSFEHWSIDASLPLLCTTVVPVAGVCLWQSIFMGGWTCFRRVRSYDIEKQ